jgi:hypothetical protein
LTPAVCIKLLTRWTATVLEKEIRLLRNSNPATRSGTFSYLCPLCVYMAKNPHMMKITFAVAIAAAVLMPATSLAGAIPAEAQNLKMAQGVDVQIGRDRDDRDRRRRNDSDVTVGVGPGGVTIGPRQNCRMVTTTVERDDGRTITRKERRCD